MHILLGRLPQDIPLWIISLETNAGIFFRWINGCCRSMAKIDTTYVTKVTNAELILTSVGEKKSLTTVQKRRIDFIE